MNRLMPLDTIMERIATATCGVALVTIFATIAMLCLGVIVGLVAAMVYMLGLLF